MDKSPSSIVYVQGFQKMCQFWFEEKLIVTTSTTPRNQNEDEDGDGDAVVRQVAVQVDDVTPL